MKQHGGDTMEHESERGIHVPVLLEETLEALRGERAVEELEGWILDGTLGAGGHARAILEAFPNVRLFGVDQDPEILELAAQNLAPFGDRARIARGRISRLCALCGEARIEEAVGVLFDLGASSLQLDRPERGFSFQFDGPLDMRMDPTRRRTAAAIVNDWDEADLADLFYYEGGERRSRRVARAIVEARRRTPFQRTAALADVVAEALGGKRGRIHPATKVFQALRRAVNEEGDQLVRGLRIAEHVLVDGGRLVILTFHSGEDGVVKRTLRERAREGHWQLVGKKPLGPGATERRSNPRARSARLRAAVRTRTEAPKRHAACDGGEDFP
ncbi:MAG TPA: 16S rRNA (cytosine(1402)-N(4))-methyltransferase RsmH [Planctomycetes bacterium]|nr:16S rRNA (cytosine(1402)-N(4))-methyltransferase RsmH [Planctomycetota bacterium]